ncbi:MAG: hypothetical protein Q8Q41_01895 [bacterium]|nr:hypothetical protein [bacterium]
MAGNLTGKKLNVTVVIRLELLPQPMAVRAVIARLEVLVHAPGAVGDLGELLHQIVIPVLKHKK